MSARWWVVPFVILCAFAGTRSSNPARAPDRLKEVPALIDALGAEGWRAAYGSLVGIGRPAIPQLSNALYDKRQSVRWHAVEALTAIGGPETIPPLIKAMADSDKDVRRYAGCGLVREGKDSPEARAAVKRALFDPEPAVVSDVITVMAQEKIEDFKRDDALVDSLCAHLNDEDLTRRQQAAGALGTIGNPRACTPLVKALAASDQPGLSGALGYALVNVRTPAAVPRLVDLVKDPEKPWHVRSAAARGLQAAADPKTNKDLLPLLADERTWESVTMALGFRGNKEAVPRLVEIAGDERAKGRWHAVQALGRIGDAQAVPVLERELAAQENIARESATALGLIGSPKAVPALIRALQDKRPYIIQYAAQSLGQIGDVRAAPALIALFDKQDACQVTAASTHFANIATVAHLALVKIAKRNPVGEPRDMVHKDNVAAVRDAWRKALNLEPTASRPK